MGLQRMAGPDISASMDALTSFLPSIQLAITPVILISGMGALMLTLTNRMGRIVDRTRSLAGALRAATGDERRHIDMQLEIMWSRAGLIQRAVTLNGLSMLFSGLLILAIFASSLFNLRLEFLVMGLFGTSIILLLASLVEFLRDIFATLRALRLEVERARNISPPADG